MGNLHLASKAEKEVENDHVQWRNPGSESRRDASQGVVAEKVDAAISELVAEECIRVGCRRDIRVDIRVGCRNRLT